MGIIAASKKKGSIEKEKNIVIPKKHINKEYVTNEIPKETVTAINVLKMLD